uniref:Uncharacterized protein n=1 Tax=Timema genevievae TaxID=629358 RepID=A0A7R9PQW6_TIMGE|nr:unnamed protein product [Timema genevievae]
MMSLSAASLRSPRQCCCGGPSFNKRIQVPEEMSGSLSGSNESLSSPMGERSFVELPIELYLPGVDSSRQSTCLRPFSTRIWPQYSHNLQTIQSPMKHKQLARPLDSSSNCEESLFFIDYREERW